MTEIIGTKSSSLKGKTIVLAVCGSIACVRAFDLCRELIRRGARVQVVASRAALEMIGEKALEFASGQKVITEISGAVEHVKFFGAKGKGDLLLVAPATANTISKIALGIDDTPITTFATTAIGAGKPVLLAPAMHEPMYKHPLVKENLARLEKRGVRIIMPFVAEEKAKMQEIEGICLEVERALTKQSLAGKKVLIAGGACVEEVDATKVLATKSGGHTAVELSREAFRRASEVTLVHSTRLFVEPQIRQVRAENFAQFHAAIFSELKKGADVFLCPAALSDFSVKKQAGKIDSRQTQTITLTPNKKLLSQVRKKFPQLSIVGFKAQSKLTKTQLEKKAQALLQKHGLDVVVANNIEDVKENENKVMIVSRKKSFAVKGKKSEIAKKVFEELLHIK